MAAESEAAMPAPPPTLEEARPPLQRLGPLNVEDLGPSSDDRVDGVPKLGDRIMVVKEPWLDLILEGAKTMEIRGCKRRPGFVWLARQGSVYGSATITESIVLSPDEFRARESEHCWPVDKTLPYKRPCGLLLAETQKLPTPIPYWRPPAAIGWNIFRKGPEDVLVKPSKPQKLKRERTTASTGVRQRKRRNGEQIAAATPTPCRKHATEGAH